MKLFLLTVVIVSWFSCRTQKLAGPYPPAVDFIIDDSGTVTIEDSIDFTQLFKLDDLKRNINHDTVKSLLICIDTVNIGMEPGVKFLAYGTYGYQIFAKWESYYVFNEDPCYLDENKELLSKDIIVIESFPLKQ